MDNTRRIYFEDNKKFFKYALLKEHEWYLYCFQKKLRTEEKASNIFSRFICRLSKNKLGAKLGIYIPAGVFGEGLHIWHYGNIIVNAESKIGKNCMLHGDNCIGNNGKTEGCPIIGDNVDIGTGAKILGAIQIANGVKIGAGAVVVKSCLTENATIVGIPGKEVEKGKRRTEMDKTPKISVIMSAYNESFDELNKSIDSIINQTYQNIEFIIVSDNPENKNIKMAVQAANDQRIKFIENKENIGLVQSLNRAISKATGKFIARMDADDISRKNRLKDELQYMQQNNLDIVGSFIETIDESGDVQKDKMRFPITASHVKLFIRWGSCLAHPTWLAKSKVYQTLKGYRNVPRCEDYDFILRAIAYGYKAGNIPKVELSYRIRQSGVSKSHEVEQFLLRDYLSKNMKRIDSLTEESITEFLDSEIFHRQLEQFSHYKNSKQIIKNETGIKKIKGIVKITGNQFLWKDIVEKMTLLIREHM